MKILEATPYDPTWAQVTALLPDAVSWVDNPDDDGDYRFLVAIGKGGDFLGASVIEIGDLYFGPLRDMSAGFLEGIETLPVHRGRGVGAALLRATLKLAWGAGCESVRSTVDYDNSAALALYRSQGFGFIPQEDLDAAESEACYTIVAINPNNVAKGYGRDS